MRDERIVLVFFILLVGVPQHRAVGPDGCPYLDSVITDGMNSTRYTIGGLFSIHQRTQGHDARIYCTLKSDFHDRALHREGVELTEALGLAVDAINADDTLLGNATLGFAIRDTCGLLDGTDCVNDVAKELVQEHDVTATVVGPFHSDGSDNVDIIRVENVFRQLFKLDPQSREPEGRGIFPVLDIPELPDIEPDDFRESVRYVGHTCDLQARAAIDFLEHAGWQDIVVITSSDNCGQNISVEFYKLVQERKCKFKTRFYEEKSSKAGTRTHVTGTFDPTDISTFSTHTVFQTLEKEGYPDAFVVFSSISFGYSLLGPEGLYKTFYIDASLRRRSAFLLGDFWGEPRHADDLYETINNLVNDTKQVVSLRTHLSGYDKFQDHMAGLRLSSRQMKRNTYLEEYWQEYFGCTVSVNCTDDMKLEVIRRPILRNTNALVVIDSVYTIAAYVEVYRKLFPTNRGVRFDDYGLRRVNVTSWTGNVIMMDKLYFLSYVQSRKWAYDILILKNEAGRMVGEEYGLWTMTDGYRKDRLFDLKVFRKNVSVSLWSPQPIPNEELCPITPTVTPTIASTTTPIITSNSTLINIGQVSKPEEYCSSEDVRGMVALPVFILLLLCVVGLTYGIIKGWISVWGTMLKFGSILLLIVTAASILLSILIATDAVSALSCDHLVADFLVNIVGCVCYTVMLIAVLAKGIGKKLKRLKVKATIFLLLFVLQIILSSIGSFHIDNEKSSNITNAEQCVDARDHPLIYVSYCLNCIIILTSTIVFIATFKRVRIQRPKPPSWATPIMSFILTVIFLVLIAVFLWSGSCLVQVRLLVVLAVFPAFAILSLILRIVVSLSYKKHVERKQSIVLPDGLNVNSNYFQREPSHHYVASAHVDSQIIIIPADFWDEDIVKAIKEVLIEPRRIQVQAKIGKGNFGEVFKGTMDGKIIALKSVQDRMNQNEVNGFVREGLQMKVLNHVNVMELYGICWSSDPAHARHVSPLIVLPYMELGDLKTYLRKRRPGRRATLVEDMELQSEERKPISTLQLVQFAWQIACGMEYIADKGIVHRDLATRNCMVSLDLKIKIADFGLARTMKEGKDYYRMDQGGQLPVRWMSIESLLDFTFTTKSDVWSYGVTLWEVMTLAQLPYPGISNQEVIPLLKRGRRLQRPDECPQEVYDIMRQCWLQNAEDRMTFTQIYKELDGYLERLAEYCRTFNPDPQEDPYMHWKLCHEIAEGLDEDDDPGLGKPDKETNGFATIAPDEVTKGSTKSLVLEARDNTIPAEDKLESMKKSGVTRSTVSLK